MSSSNDLRFLRAALPQLKDYLLSSEIFWNLGFDPQLTLGNLLLAETQVSAGGNLSTPDEQLLSDLNARKKEWHSAWQKKAEREFRSRLRQWTQYLQELSEHPSRFAAQYKTEVRVRALLELLADEASGLRGQLAASDSKLKALTVAGDYGWGEETKAAFPQSRYWFLYAKPNISKPS